MRIMTSYLHGLLDYGIGLLIVASPWLFKFSQYPAAAATAIVLGLAGIGYSLVTNYEISQLKLLPMGGHLALDLLSGVLLVLAPWLLGFSNHVWLPFLIFGLGQISLALLTETFVSQRGGISHI